MTFFVSAPFYNCVVIEKGGQNMKNKLKEKLNIATFTGVILFIVCALLLIRNFPFCVKMIRGAALLSAKTVLVTVSDDETREPKHSEKQSKATTQPVTEETAETQPVAQTAEQVSEDQSEKSDSFTYEPADIKKLIEKYEASASKDKKDGAITEITYTTSGVTDTYKNVRVKNVNDTKIDIEKLLSRKPDIDIKDKSQPAVLIFHTHTTEGYQILDRDFYARGYVTRSENNAVNMVRVGDEICTQLEKAGYSVIHDTTIYDKQYNGAYQRSRVTVEEYLKKYPSIQVTLDIHRDAIQYTDGTKAKPVNTIKGKKCAQMMIISGCQEKGNGIEGFPDWEYNLVFALHLQRKLEDMYPGIMRPLYFCPRRYNMNVNHASLLIEIGSDANTLSEGVYAGRCLGTALSQLLDDLSST